MPTKGTPTKRPREPTPHETPAKQVISGGDIETLSHMRGKGFLSPQCNSLIIEVINNDIAYPSAANKAKRLGVSKATALRYMHAVSAGRDPITPPQHRAPTATPEQQKAVSSRRKRVLQLWDEDDNRSAADIATMLAKEGVEASRHTVWRDLTEHHGKVFMKDRKVPAKYDEKTRKAFANEEIRVIERARKMLRNEGVDEEDSTPYYIFGDETWCNATHRTKGRFRNPDGERSVVKCKERFTPKVNTFGILTEDKFRVWDMPSLGDGPRGGVTGEQFRRCFFRWLGPMLVNVKKWAGKRPVRLVLDGAGIHGKEKVGAWCRDKNIEFVMNWPSHSPDLNPIENLWSHMKNRIGSELQIYTMKDHEASKARISKKRDAVARKITKATCFNYTRSFEERLKKCVDRQGSHTGY